MNIIGPDHFQAPAQKPSLKNIANFLEIVGNALAKKNYRDVDTALLGRFVRVDVTFSPQLLPEEEQMACNELASVGWKKVCIHTLMTTSHEAKCVEAQYKVVFWFND
jgi:hypothetical protein